MSGAARFLYGLALGLSLGIIGARLAATASSAQGHSGANGRSPRPPTSRPKAAARP